MLLAVWRVFLLIWWESETPLYWMSCTCIFLEEPRFVCKLRSETFVVFLLFSERPKPLDCNRIPSPYPIYPFFLSAISTALLDVQITPSLSRHLFQMSEIPSASLFASSASATLKTGATELLTPASMVTVSASCTAIEKQPHWRDLDTLGAVMSTV